MCITVSCIRQQRTYIILSTQFFPPHTFLLIHLFISPFFCPFYLPTIFTYLPYFPTCRDCIFPPLYPSTFVPTHLCTYLLYSSIFAAMHSSGQPPSHRLTHLPVHFVSPSSWYPPTSLHPPIFISVHFPT